MRTVHGQTRRTHSSTILWPAYLVAAVCFAIALISSLYNLSLLQQLRSAQTRLEQAESRANALTRNLSNDRTLISDLIDDEAQHYALPDGDVVRVHGRLYLTMHDLAPPPRGHVYQAWTQARGAQRYVPAGTFVPDTHGAAVIALSVDAAATTSVAVTIEPEGGSKTPSVKPIAVTSID